VAAISGACEGTQPMKWVSGKCKSWPLEAHSTRYSANAATIC